jgi:acetyl-CoA carboxylase carboxyl transferase subunit alpha
MPNILSTIRSANRVNADDFINLGLDSFQEIITEKKQPAVITGIATINSIDFILIATRRGKDIISRVKNNFSLITPDGYSAALEALNLGFEKKLPIITLVEVIGADPSVESENNGQNIAITKLMQAMGEYSYKNATIIISEGHSGGALAFANVNKFYMLENSIFNVASPEATASILKNKYSAQEISEKLPMTADSLKKIGLVDEIIPEKDDLNDQIEQIRSKIGEFLIENIKFPRENRVKKLRTILNF